MSEQDPIGWFDQFTPHELDAAGVSGNEQWCARHWAPCPILGANGIKATVLLISYFADGLMINGRICCMAGDQAMYDIWGQCPPEGRIPHGSRY